MTENIAVGTDSNGRRFTIDIEDWVKCKDICWCVDTQGYVKAQINGKYTSLHRFIMNPADDKVVDHINHDTTNNCKSNLRIVTQQQNMMNRCTNKNNTSGYAGVKMDSRYIRWEASIGYKGKYIFLGYFTNKEDAIKARKEAEVKYFGEYRKK